MTDKINRSPSRARALRELMKEQGLDAVLIGHDDEYLSEELSPECERLRWLTAFSGSAGACCMLREEDSPILEKGVSVKGADGKEYSLKRAAALFVDGRYTLQVTVQADAEIYDSFNSAALAPEAWLRALLDRGAKVGVDLSCMSWRAYLKLKAGLDREGIELVDLKKNPVDAVWEDRPAPVHTKVEIFPDEFNGCPSPQKRRDLAKRLRDRGLDATVICDPESICWLLNIRGRDRHCLPVVNCRMVAYSNEALEWYISDDHLDEEKQKQLEAHIGHIDIFPENRFDEVLERLCTSQSAVFADPDSVSAHVLKTLKDGGARVTEGLGLCQMPKACKNHVEIAGEYKAHIKDGIAMCRFLSWLDELTCPLKAQSDPEGYRRRVSDTDEKVLAERAESFRKVEQGYIEPSFDTISALGTNASMVHYNHLNTEKPKALGDSPLYMIDSGAHYLDGTTDITRTVLVGPGLTDEMRRMFTLVLKAHIALATAVFPKGTSGLQLDAIARRPLWDHGCDYAHGTGHGVGHLLSVHEGPQCISSHRSDIPLQPGMVISDEPGYYKDGAFGIRTENLLVVQPCQHPGMEHMLCFSPLTLVPVDTRCLDLSMLTSGEKAWLNGYHQNVLSVIKNASATLTDTEVNWLTQAAAAI
jgi:Xaa-Pro aminopeptidase